MSECYLVECQWLMWSFRIWARLLEFSGIGIAVFWAYIRIWIEDKWGLLCFGWWSFDACIHCRRSERCGYCTGVSALMEIWKRRLLVCFDEGAASKAITVVRSELIKVVQVHLIVRRFALTVLCSETKHRWG